jgi:hypothetical protein
MVTFSPQVDMIADVLHGFLPQEFAKNVSSPSPPPVTADSPPDSYSWGKWLLGLHRNRMSRGEAEAYGISC